MKKLNKVAMLIATVVVAGTAFANGSTTNSDNWRSGHGNLQWKIGNASGLCWRDNFWTPATAAAGCDGAIVAVAAPAPVRAAPVVVAPVVAPKPAPAPAPVVAAPAPAPAPVAPAPKRKVKQDRN